MLHGALHIWKLFFIDFGTVPQMVKTAIAITAIVKTEPSTTLIGIARGSHFCKSFWLQASLILGFGDCNIMDAGTGRLGPVPNWRIMPTG